VSSPAATPASPAPPALPPRGGLRARPALKAADFEARWAALPAAEVFGMTLVRAPRDGELERALAPHHVACMASGALGGVQKFYFFAQGEGADAGSLGIAELSITLASLRLSALVKAAPPALGPLLVAALREGLEDDAFATFRREFSERKVVASLDGTRFTVSGSLPLEFDLGEPEGRPRRVLFEPILPEQSLLMVDGTEIGREVIDRATPE